MRPFLQFRLWLATGPAAERIMAAITALVALALLAWSAVPLTHGGHTGFDAVGIAPTQSGLKTNGAAAPIGSTPVPGRTMTNATSPNGTISVASLPTGGASGSRSAANSSAAQPAPADACAGVRATDVGVTPAEIHLAMPFISLGSQAGNATFGLRSPSDLQKIAQAVVAGINGAGRVACRRLTVTTYPVNPIDPVEQQQTCQKIIDAHAFAVIDHGAFLSPASRQCFIDAHIPYQSGGVNVSEAQIAASYPYMYTVGASVDRAARNWVFEAAARGWLDPRKGFRKLGLLLDECYPDVNRQLLDNLHRIGVADAQLSVFTLSGCAAINSPSEINAAVAQHRSAGVTHVFLAGNASNSPQYVKSADAIGFKPIYLTSDFESQTVPSIAKNWSRGFDGALAVTTFRTGERNSGITPAWVTRCNAWLRASDPSLQSTTESDMDPMIICDILRLFASAANSAGPNLTRRSLVDGLAAAGRFEGAQITTINSYGPRKLWAGDYLRVIQWHLDCACWKVVDRGLRPGH